MLEKSMKRNIKNATTITTSSPAPRAVEARLVLSVRDYGSRYGVKKDTIYKWVINGMPHLKMSSRLTRIPVKEADRWVNDNWLRQRET